MNDSPLYRRLAPLLRRFFGEHLVRQRGVSDNTVKAYRDAWSLLLRFGQEQRGLGPPDRWRVHHVDRECVLQFLRHLEEGRGVSIQTRNYRRAAIVAFFHFLRGLEPGLEDHCRRILAIPAKKSRRTVVGFLEADELRAVLKAVTPYGPTSSRDLALLAFAYNTGARVHEIARAQEPDIFRGTSPYIRILGKGNKEREVPLWTGTLRLLDAYRAQRRPGRDRMQDEYLFLGRTGHRLGRIHVGRIISGYIKRAAQQLPTLLKKRLRAHSMRHTTAVHLLQSGADLNTIKAWLGHASVESLQVYLDLDLKKKKEILERLVSEAFPTGSVRPFDMDAEADRTLLSWLDTL